MKRYLLDTNVLLRFLLADSDALSAKARALFARAEAGDCVLVLTDGALAESVWVLESHYKVDRATIGGTLASLVTKPGVRCPGGAAVTGALARYANTKVDYFDCYLAALAAESGDAVASFDRDLKKFKDIEVWSG